MDQGNKEYVLNAAKERQVKFIRLWFTDILGFLKNVAIPVEQLEEALDEGVGFDGSSVEGFARIDESDMIAMPDPNTFQMLPFRPQGGQAVARMFCDILEPSGRPYEGDPRQVLKRNLKCAADLGYTFYVSPELEYFYFKRPEPPLEGLDEGGYFDQTPLDVASDLRRETVLALEQMGIEVASSHHEGAPSQHEIDLLYTDALTMADNAMTYRLVVKEIALKNDVWATFMPKPLYGVNGNGMHTHMSLFKGERNAFYNARDAQHLSRVAKQYIAGLLAHAPDITLVTNQWVNSYKRLVPGYEAPVYTTWASVNRSDLVRVPAYKPGKESAVRVEYRSPDPACNPYLAFSVMLASGLDGIEKKRRLPATHDGDAHDLSAAERDRLKISMLPQDLSQAIDQAEGSELVRRALGSHVFEKFIENKKIEWSTYRAQVTGYELERDLKLL
ncbi:MAG: glutamine synthetase [Gemmatimonadetes bacterium]|nr:glutamine synthetase [Gemmatimonadota bacterium]|tara:strand:+ start:1177 stop:2511 length:1335 start_codon:yes stop_codon:yes gene_type:complete